MDGPGHCHSELSKTEKEKYDIPYMWNLKRNDTKELTEQKDINRLREQTFGFRGRKKGEKG